MWPDHINLLCIKFINRSEKWFHGWLEFCSIRLLLSSVETEMITTSKKEQQSSLSITCCPPVRCRALRSAWSGPLSGNVAGNSSPVLTFTPDNKKQCYINTILKILERIFGLWGKESEEAEENCVMKSSTIFKLHQNNIRKFKLQIMRMVVLSTDEENDTRKKHLSWKTWSTQTQTLIRR